MRRHPPLLLLTLFALVLAFPSPARAACSTTPASNCTTSPGVPAGGAGSREYVCTGDTVNKVQYFDGYQWQDYALKSSAGTECVSPMGPGAWNYGSTADHDWEYCDNAGTPVCHQLDCARYCSSPVWNGTLTTYGPLTETDNTSGMYGNTDTANSHFGAAVAVNDTVAVIAAPNKSWYAGVANAGYIYLYDISNPVAGPVWTNMRGGVDQTSELFGFSLAISGNLLLVGAPGENSAKGAVFVYSLVNRDGALNGLLQLAEITDPLATNNDQFGYSVAVDGNTAVIGAVGSTNVYVYDLTNISTTPTPGPASTLSAPSGATNFGFSVAVSGSRMIAGAYGATANAGAIAAAGRAYVYDVTNLASIPAPAEITAGSPAISGGNGDAGANAAASDAFGYSVAISGTIAVASSYKKAGTFANAGKFYVYDVTTPATPVYKAPIANPDGSDLSENFGKSMAMSGVKLVVGAPGYAAGGSAGAIFVYDLSIITAPAIQAGPLQGNFVVNGNLLGSSVAISNDRIAVGAPNQAENFQSNAGGAYVVTANCNGASCYTYGTCTAEGQMEYSSSWDLEYCNPSLKWAPFGPCLTPSLGFTTPLLYQTRGSLVKSNIIEIPVSVNCSQAVSINATVLPGATYGYRICSDYTCSTNPAFVTGASTASAGSYLQLELTASASYSTTSSITLTVGNDTLPAWTVQSTLTPKTVFITSSTWRGGGASGFNTAGTWVIGNADARCQTLADAAGIGTIATGRTYKAWIAGSTADDPNTRFTKTFSYVDTRTAGNGGPLTIWNSWSDLTASVFQNPISRNESGTVITADRAWTNVNNSGVAISNGPDTNVNCASAGPVNPWTSGASGNNAYTGATNVSGATWTTDGTNNQCSSNNRLYCFEQ